jgi:hypothetical protein
MGRFRSYIERRRDLTLAPLAPAARAPRRGRFLQLRSSESRLAQSVTPQVRRASRWGKHFRASMTRPHRRAGRIAGCRTFHLPQRARTRLSGSRCLRGFDDPRATCRRPITLLSTIRSGRDDKPINFGRPFAAAKSYSRQALRNCPIWSSRPHCKASRSSRTSTKTIRTKSTTWLVRSLQQGVLF